ncbi:MAG: MSMEG_0568 family radical SAM protein, partial [Limnobacter sp.]|nr:MSMEG_0568 family radical SAM protein [Limnobacter sp.]
MLSTDLQTLGLRLEDPSAGLQSRRGGAGPSDHKAVSVEGKTIMIPVHTHTAWDSPYMASKPDPNGQSELRKNGIPIAVIQFPKQPNFYALKTSEGIPYEQIATMHSKDVLATTVLQTCIRYESRSKSCKFCSIGQSLAAGRTIERKTPQQLAEVAKAAVELDGVTQMVMTTGTPATPDRGAAIMVESVAAVKAAVDLPIQVQIEPPDRFDWFDELKRSGADTLGMHLEVLSEEVRQEMMPGKARVPVSYYMEAFDAAVKVFGRGQVSTYIIAGLGDTQDQILEMSQQLIQLGVYPFIVPFVPISGTPLESHPVPSSQFMTDVLKPV